MYLCIHFWQIYIPFPDCSGRDGKIQSVKSDHQKGTPSCSISTLTKSRFLSSSQDSTQMTEVSKTKTAKPKSTWQNACWALKLSRKCSDTELKKESITFPVLFSAFPSKPLSAGWQMPQRYLTPTRSAANHDYFLLSSQYICLRYVLLLNTLVHNSVA